MSPRGCEAADHTDRSGCPTGGETGSAETGIAPTDKALAILRIPGIALEVPVNYGTDEWVLLRGAGLVEGAGERKAGKKVAHGGNRN